MRPLALLLGALTLVVAGAAAGAPLQVGSKKFTESVVLGEMLRQLVEAADYPVRHRRELGGTRVVWNALLAGDVDAYPDYTGTLTHEVLAGEGITGLAGLRRALAERGLAMTAPLGFNNTYAIGVPRALAERLGLARISDLARHPELRLGFGNEFMDRADGWPGLRRAYGLPHQDVRGLDHDLAYRGIAAGAIDVMDMYRTDAEIAYYDLVALEDDRGHFPPYDAVIVYRADLAERAPAAAAALHRLEGRIDADTMVALNGRVKLDGESEAAVAAAFLERELGIAAPVLEEETTWDRFRRHTGEHLGLVAVSLSAAVLVAVPLGIAAARRPRLGQGILGVVGVVQTIPSLALFVFMIPLLGIGGPPAVAALFLYSLLPIVRNTHAGLTGIPPEVRDSAEALGLSPGARLWRVELPLAARSILAGVKTSAVLNVGTATLAALIGAGGYGQPILTGIRLDDLGLILEGAIPAALLALAVQGLFELIEPLFVPRGLRVRG
jgi:osmoprotectant transport system permease protein